MTPHSRICGKCAIKWPLGFVRCPSCEEPTKVLIGVKPDRTKEQATYASREREFMAYYAEHEQRRIASGAYAPEEVGRQEARQQIELGRQLGG